MFPLPSFQESALSCGSHGALAPALGGRDLSLSLSLIHRLRELHDAGVSCASSNLSRLSQEEE